MIYDEGMSMISNDSRFRPAADIIFRRFDAEGVLIHRRDAVADLTNHVFLENEVSVRMWELLSAGASVAQAAGTLAEEFEVAEHQAEADLRSFSASLVAAEFLVPLCEPRCQAIRDRS